MYNIDDVELNLNLTIEVGTHTSLDGAEDIKFYVNIIEKENGKTTYRRAEVINEEINLYLLNRLSEKIEKECIKMSEDNRR
ncbi:MAG: hypothetical protein JSW06_02830 [Thermoplasmatales archaeon]|nr:MAG: hypothetical protein JSW06_02830 [Thermoplasmatales archaeon]